jgi:tetratricopeptide (TPR) repeat protein
MFRSALAFALLLSAVGCAKKDRGGYFLTDIDLELQRLNPEMDKRWGSKDYRGALEIAERMYAVAMAPGADHHWELAHFPYRRGQLFFKLGEYARAEADFEEAIRIRSAAPMGPSKELFEALAAARKPDLEAGIAALDQRIASEPPSSELHLQRALLFQRRGSKGDGERAAADAARAADLAPDAPALRWSAGGLLFCVGDAEGAKRQYAQAEALYPAGSELGLLRLGLIAERGKDPALAMQLYTQALEGRRTRKPEHLARFGEPEVLGPERRRECFHRRGMIYFGRTGGDRADKANLERALRDFEAGMAEDPLDPDLCYFRLKTYFLLDIMTSVLGAADDFHKALKSRPDARWDNDYSIPSMTSIAAFRTENWKRVESSASVLTDGMHGRSSEAWLMRAVAAEHLGNYRWAAQFLRRARDLNPSLPPVRLPKTEEFLRDQAAHEDRQRREQAAADAEFLRAQRERKALAEGRANYDFDKVLKGGLGNLGDDNWRAGAELDRRMREDAAYHEKVRDAWARSRTSDQLRTNLRLVEIDRPAR